MNCLSLYKTATSTPKEFFEKFEKSVNGNWLNLENQAYFLKKIVQDDCIKEYPVPVKFTFNLMKYYYNEIEYKGPEGVDEELFEEYLKLQEVAQKM